MKRFCIGRYCVVFIYRKERSVSWVCILFVAGGGYSLGSASCREWKLGPKAPFTEAVLDSLEARAENYFSYPALAPIFHQVADFSQFCRLQAPWRGTPSLSSSAFFLCFYLENHWAAWARFRLPAQTIITLVGGVRVRSVCQDSRREDDKEGPLYAALERKSCSYFFRQFFKNGKILFYKSNYKRLRKNKNKYYRSYAGLQLNVQM